MTRGWMMFALPVHTKSISVRRLILWMVMTSWAFSTGLVRRMSTPFPFHKKEYM